MMPRSKKIKQFFKIVANQRRDARYVILLTVASIIFLITYSQAISNGLFNSFERPLFYAINQLPHALYPLFYTFTQFGGLGSIPIWIGIAWYLINKRAALTVFIGIFFGWLIANTAKTSVHRGRPGSLLNDVNLFHGEKFSGFGFPSGHSTVVAAVVTILYFQVDPRYRKYLLGVALMVGVSRMYLGAHFPLDVVGGYALGAVVGSIILLVGGLSKEGLSATKIKNSMD